MEHKENNLVTKYEKIGILDHMGYGNLGDAATQDVVIHNIRLRLPECEIIGFSYEPEDTCRRHNIASYPLLRGYVPAQPDEVIEDSDEYSDESAGLRTWLKSKLERFRPVFIALRFISDILKEMKHFVNSYKVLKSLDLLIISGGGQLGDSYRSMPVNVFKFSFLAKLAGAKLYILNVGAGPLRYFLTKRCARWSVRLADYVSFRDQDSRDLLNKLGVRRSMQVHPDSVYAYEINLSAEELKHTGQVKKVGFNPSGFCDPRIWPKKDERAYRTFLTKIISFCTWLHESGYTLEVFSSDLGVDKFVIEDLKNTLSSRWSEDMIKKSFPPVSNSSRDLVHQMAGYDYIITTKFHGLIFSHLLGKSVIALSWHRKNKVLMEDFGQGEYCIDIESFEVQSLKDAFRSLDKNREKLNRLAKEKVEKYSSDLRGQFNTLFAATQGEV
jgi:polysaccharide pyruvyl transferase WcaK-like protein